MYEYPPILKGSERQQLQDLRDYLVRMARSLQEAEQAADRSEQASPSLALSQRPDTAPAPETGPADAQEARRLAGQLRSLILKTAQRMDESLGGQIHTVRQELERIDASLREDYLAVSDFGAYAMQAELSMSATARQIVEGYAFSERIDAVSSAVDGLDLYMTNIQGEIRRGLITDPETGEQAMGIAISENLHFTGQTQTRDGLVYHELSPGQTLGLYTATGWQFWINGSKRGWFDSADGRLHVTRMRAVDSIDLGGAWQLSSAGGLGIQYIGA